MNHPTSRSTNNHFIIGVEGPAGSGKSTMANTVGRDMGITVIEGGSYYRLLTYAALSDCIALTDTDRLVKLASDMPIRFSQSENGDIFSNGVLITNELRTERISTKVAEVSGHLAVREIVEEQIKNAVLAHKTSIVVGRWIKKLFPDAYVLNLTIDPEEAERRHVSRTNGQPQSVRERNDADISTAQKLGVVAGAHEASIDVTYMTADEQATALKDFITACAMK